MKNVFIEYPKCSTCKKAKKWLEDNKIEFDDRNIVVETPTVEELTAWIGRSGLDIKKWFNTSGLKYKELNLKEKLVDMSEDEKIKLLASDGMLIKRPILVSDKYLLVGFKEEEWNCHQYHQGRGKLTLFLKNYFCIQFFRSFKERL